jgi:DNA-binding winged helix-turn-helix (wHTH) protein/class 3 adenylate cyclase/tetratricopeptide (TPR) repeat protein
MRYAFADCVLDTQLYTLTRAGCPRPLRPKVFQVLAYLLRHRDHVVSREELCAQVWPGQCISETTLESCIKQTRQAIGDSGQAQQLIATRRGYGYRFLGAVEVCPDPPAGTGGGDGLALQRSLSTLPLATPNLVPGLSPQETAGAVDGGPEPDTRGAEASLQHSVSASVGEWKLVTVLCCALAAPPPAAPREAEPHYHALHALAVLAAAVQRYGGTLQPVVGDHLIALFGAPRAQEDHARCAVLAALDLQQRLHQPPTPSLPALGAGLAVRMGVHSGLVVVGELGPAAHGQVTAVGAPSQGALRLQQQAAPGTLLVSAATYRLVQEEVAGVLGGSLVLEGSQPQPVYTIQGVRQRRAGVPQRPPPSASPFVGRQRELALLHDRLEAVRTGEGQAVSLVGPPGIGKTRLLTEFGRGLAPDQVIWYSGQCLAYSQAAPYLPVRDIVQQVCALAAGEAQEAHTAAVRRRLAALGEVTEEDVALVCQLLDLPVAPEWLARLTPEARQARTFALLERLIRHAAQRQPVVLAVENVHWIDPTSAAWLAFLVERLTGLAVLLLVTQRPGAPPSWGTHAAVTQLALPPLRVEESQVIVAAVPGTAQLPAARCQQIVAHGAGNPFFLEELAWQAVEHGRATTPVSVPATVHAVLAARLDQLPAEEKALLQTAAVIGQEVSVPLLRAMADVSENTLQRCLAHLRATALLSETRLFLEQEYTFKHALTHEVAYGSLLQEQRRVLHARLVEVLEARAGDQVAEHVERLAHHALRGEVWDKALAYCRQAGARAYDRAAFREAVAAFEQALQALAHLPEDGDTRVLALDLRLALGGTLFALGEYGRRLALLGEAEVLARALDDRARLVRVLAWMAHALWLTGDTDGAVAAGQQALELAAALGDSALQVQASDRLGEVYWSIGDFGRAAALLRWSVEAADRESGTPSTDVRIDVRIQSRGRLAQTLGALGAFAEGRRHGEEALRLATLEGRGSSPIAARGYLGGLYLAQGDLEHAIQVWEQGLALCCASGNRDWLRSIMAGLGSAYALQGRFAEGRTLLEEAIRESISTGARWNHANQLTRLGEVCRLAGRYDEAWQYARQALDLARQQQARGIEARALYQLGAVRTRAAPPDVAQAAAHYHQALALAEELGMRPLQAHCHRGLGILYATTGQQEQAHVELSTAMNLYRAMEMTFWLPETEAALAQVEGR